MNRRRPQLIAAIAALVLLLPLAKAATLRIASGFDPQTLDPHAIALLYHSRVITQVYESLVNRDRGFAVEPSLAMSWKPVDDRTWRFVLRPGVRFHDGTPFGADDVVFSIERALARSSQRAFQLRGVAGARKVDALTVDILLSTPDPLLPERLYLIAMMSRAWSERHGVTVPQDFNAKQETHAVRNANGTGPYMVRHYAPDSRTELVAHPQWWGKRGNVDQAVFMVIQSDATRLAALVSGEVDLVLDPPFQDVGRLKRNASFRVTETSDMGTQYLGFDQARTQPESADTPGRNPFKDLRVRRAIAHAIDVDTIIAKVLRGQAKPTGAFFSALVDGVPAALDKRLPYDPAAARRLLAEAGYPKGFGIGLDCVNIAWRASVCQAIAGMLAQVDIRVAFQPSPSPQFFPKLTQGTTSFFEVGWTPQPDPWPSLNALVRTFGTDGQGTFNGGRYSNPALDAIIDGMRGEGDLAKRRAMTAQALQIIHADLPLIPLYRRTLAWVMKAPVHVVQWPNDIFEIRFAEIR